MFLRLNVSASDSSERPASGFLGRRTVRHDRDSGIRWAILPDCVNGKRGAGKEERFIYEAAGSYRPGAAGHDRQEAARSSSSETASNDPLQIFAPAIALPKGSPLCLICRRKVNAKNHQYAAAVARFCTKSRLAPSSESKTIPKRHPMHQKSGVFGPFMKPFKSYSGLFVQYLVFPVGCRTRGILRHESLLTLFWQSGPWQNPHLF